MANGGLWVLVTLMASGAQTLRNAMQRDLIGALGAVGAAQVRFLFGLPFAVLFFFGLLAATGLNAPALSFDNLGWTAFGAFCAGDRDRDDAGGDAHDELRRRRRLHQDRAGADRLLRPRCAQPNADAAAGRGDRDRYDRRRAYVGAATGRSSRATGARRRLGIASATFFAFAAIGFRSAVIGVDTPSRALAASLILVLGLAIQAAALALYLGLFDRAGARKILAAWRSSLIAGFMGALASQFWFLAFALTDAARVRTLGLIEAPLA